MDKLDKRTGFLTYDRKNAQKVPPKERIKNFLEFENPLTEKEIQIQATRCMNCGVPFCHDFGCPLGNRIPDINDKLFRGLWDEALALLHSTNNFPEFTGKVCPAPCEEACTLSIDDDAVSFREIEERLVEYGWQNDLIKPIVNPNKSGKRVAIIGSGPAGLAAAQQLARAGHDVRIFEKDQKAGGLLRYGIPDYKLNKAKIDRRLNQMKHEGVTVETDVNIGEDISFHYLVKSFDAVLISAGAREPRDLDIPGRDLEGIHQALDYLTKQNKLNSNEPLTDDPLTAKNKKVVVIGGGDTGADCVGTAIRQGAKSVTQIEIMPKPPEKRQVNNPWPEYRHILRTATSHEEGCERIWSRLTKEFKGKLGKVEKIITSALDWNLENRQFTELESRPIEADLVLLAIGFYNNEKCEIISKFLNKSSPKFKLSEAKMSPVFTAGDVVNGPSLVVNAIQSGRTVAEKIDKFLE